MKSRGLLSSLISLLVVTQGLWSCSVFSGAYKVTKGAVKTTLAVASLSGRAAMGTARLTYTLGKKTYQVMLAPLDWPFTHDLDSIDGLSPREAIRLGRVKNAPYTVRGVRYRPMTVSQAQRYREVGIASWYGEETRRRVGGHMTANGEVFDPAKPTAAHKYLPLPTHVRVTNLENGRSMLVRVNDRGPFVRGRIIDLSAGAARQLGFRRQGTARVLVETVPL